MVSIYFPSMNKRLIIITPLVIILGYLLRVWGQPASYYWTSDIARDFLVGSHIAIYGESLFVGHTAAGFGTSFYYPPYTYYLYALLQHIFPTPELLIGFFLLMHAVSIGLLVVAVYKLFGKDAALFTGIFIALSAKMIDISRFMLVSPALPLLYVALLFCIYAIKKQSLGYLSCGIFCVLYASMFHYSALLYVPLLYIVWVAGMKKKSAFALLAPLAISASIFVLLLIPLIHYFGPYEILRHLSPQNNFSGNVIGWGEAFPSLIQRYLTLIFMDNSALGISTLLGISAIIVIRRGWRWLVPAILMLGYIGAVIAAMACMRASVQDHFFIYFIPVCITISGYVFGRYRNVLPNNALGHLIFIFPFVIFLFSISGRFSYLYSSQPLGLTQSRAIAKNISTYIQQRDEIDGSFQHSVRVYVSGPNSPIWGTSTIMYFLEKDLHKKLIYLINSDTSIAQYNSDDYIIVACRYLTKDTLAYWNINSLQWNKNVCIANFLHKFPQYAAYSLKELSDLNIYDAQILLFSARH